MGDLTLFPILAILVVSTQSYSKSIMTFSTRDSLNWNVISRDLHVKVDGLDYNVPGKIAQLRDDTNEVIGITSPTYQVFQNSDLLNLIDPLIDEGLLEITNMGYLGKGGKVFVQAQMAEEYRIVGESHKARITLLNSHDGSAALASGITDHRVICSNTFAMAMTDMDKRIRHNSSIFEKALDITEVCEYVNSEMKRFNDAAETLKSSRVVGSMLDDLIAATYNKPVENVRAANSIKRFFRQGAGNEGETLWDALNAITQYTTHHASSDPGKRFASVNFGGNALRNRRAMNAALTLV